MMKMLQKPRLNAILLKCDLYSKFSFPLVHTYVRWKGTGEPGSNFLRNLSADSLERIAVCFTTTFAVLSCPKSTAKGQ